MADRIINSPITEKERLISRPQEPSLIEDSPVEDREASQHQQSWCSMKKELKILKVMIVVTFFVAVLCMKFVMESGSKIQMMIEYNKVESVQVHEMNSRIDLVGLRGEDIEARLELLAKTIDEMRLEMYQMDVELVKRSSHHSNLFNLFNQEKDKVRSQLQQLSQRIVKSQPKYGRQINQLNNIVKADSFILPKVIWIYTDNELEGSELLERFLSNVVSQMGSRSEYTVRWVDSLSAYQWLSPLTQEKIHHAMLQRYIDFKIGDLLRIALLMQHGGVVFKLSENLFVEPDFNWLSKYIRTDEKSNLTVYSSVVLFLEDSNLVKSPQYQDFFMAASKGAPLIKDLFNTICQILSTGNIEFKGLREQVRIKESVNSTYIPNLVGGVISSLADIMTKQFYGITDISTHPLPFIQECQSRLIQLLKQPEWEFKFMCGEHHHVIHIQEKHRSQFEEDIESQVWGDLKRPDKFSYWQNWLVPDNLNMMKPQRGREAFLCFLDAEPNSNLELIKGSFEKLKQQTFKNWTAVYFLDHQNPQIISYINEQNKHSQRFAIRTPTHTGTIGRNYEVGIIHECPQKSVIVVLRRHERLQGRGGVDILVKKMEERGVLGVLVGLNVSGEVKQSQTYYQWYNKFEFTGRPSNQYLVPSKVLNYLRVFHSDCYKIIPQFELRTTQGSYFNNRFSFLEQFLYMVRNISDPHEMGEGPHQQRLSWMVRNSSDIFDVPNRIIVLRELIINTDQWENVDSHEIEHNIFKIDSETMKYNLDHLLQQGLSMKKLAVFNPGRQFEPYTIRDKKAVIPKVIHTFWLQGQLPLPRKKIMELNKELYPDFEFKHWSKQNITKENFPLTFQLLQLLFRIQITSRYSKRIPIIQLMIIEVLYHQGGFHVDSNVFLFTNTLKQWLSYKLVLPIKQAFHHRWSQPLSFFGVQPNFSGLLRLLQPAQLNRQDLWKINPVDIFGERSFSQIVSGMEEYDPDYLILSEDTFYSTTFSMPIREDSYCWSEPHYLSRDDKVVMKAEGRWMIKNCTKYYPFSFGKEISMINGRTWLNPKW